MDEPDKREAALKVLRGSTPLRANYLPRSADRDKFADALDKEWPGPIPYTIVIAPGGKVLYRKVNELDPLTVSRAICLTP